MSLGIAVSLSPTALLVCATVLLVLGLIVIFRVWGRPDPFVSQSPLRALLLEFGPVISGFGLLIVCCGIVWRAYDAELRLGVDLSRSILPGFFASLVEDIVFFSALGFVIVIVQRREYDRGRNLEDRIDTLFNAKRLTSTELSELKSQLLKVGCDFQRNEAVLDVREHDPVNDCILVDVTRRWHVASYFKSDGVEYDWKLKLRPDAVPNKEVLMELFSSRAGTLKLGERYATMQDALELHPAVKLSVSETYEHQPKPIKTMPGRVHEFRSRYRAWQRLQKADGTGPDFWEFEAERHWDHFSVTVKNSLSHRMRIHIRGRETRTLELEPGAEQTEPLEITDLAKGTQIFVEFEIFTGNEGNDPISGPTGDDHARN